MPRIRLLIPQARWRRAGQGWRFARATWRSARALWRELRTPVMVFLIAVFGGGWLYGELWARAGHPRIPYVDLPYTMLALMIFETPTDLPPETQLVVFWYIMPLVAAYVAGRGVFDVARLFFSPRRHQNAWEEALAATYHDHVIVLGVGHLGTRVVRALVAMGFDVVAIDQQLPAEKTDELDRLDVPLIVGDGRLAPTLEAAGIRRAEALVVCTSNDHMNLEVTMRARDLNPTIRIVVRMWDDRFAEQIQRFMNVEAVLSTTSLAAPQFAASALGIEIAQTFSVQGVEYSMIRLEVAPGSFLDGKTVGALQDDEELDIVLHGHGAGAQVHPSPDTLVSAGDTLVIFAQHARIMGVVARNQQRRLFATD